MKVFCFTLGFGAALAGSLCAAEHLTSVVQADSKTGKLVRSVVVAPKTVKPKVMAPVAIVAAPAPSAAPAVPPESAQGLNAVVESVAARNSLPPQLIHSVIKVESNYNPNAVSRKGALGLMQLIPETARRFGVSDVFDPVENIEGGAKYLKYLLDLFNNDYLLALAAYNAGEGAVAKYNGVPPYAETRNYLLQVRRRFEESQKAADAARQKPQEVKAEPKGDAPRQIQQVVEADGTVRYIAR